MAGWWLGWIELMVVAVGCGLALLIAIPFVIGGHALRVERLLDPDRVERGERAQSQLTITNTGRSISAPRELVDSIDGSAYPVPVPILAAGSNSKYVQEIDTSRRGVIRVGPAVISKADPLGLFRRELGRTDSEELWVRPRVTALASLRAGFAKDLEGPTYDNSPAGDVAFHAVREYSRGDDHRHVHWMSTARTGRLMVRHYVDNRKAHLGVLVDDDESVYTAETFEQAMDVTASQIVSAFAEKRPVSVYVGRVAVVGASRPGTSGSAVDRLCLVSPRTDRPSFSDAAERLARAERDLSAVLLLTGARSAEEVLGAVTAFGRRGPVVVARLVTPATPPIAVPGARVVDCEDLARFVLAWRGIVQ